MINHWITQSGHIWLSWCGNETDTVIAKIFTGHTQGKPCQRRLAEAFMYILSYAHRPRHIIQTHFIHMHTHTHTHTHTKTACIYTHLKEHIFIHIIWQVNLPAHVHRQRHSIQMQYIFYMCAHISMHVHTETKTASKYLHLQEHTHISIVTWQVHQPETAHVWGWVSSK